MRARTAAPAGRARRGLLGPVPGPGRRPATLAAAGAVALLAGLGVGFGTDLVVGTDPQESAATGPADECPVVQAAWSRSATMQLSMSADDPATLRRGFVGARDELAGVRPPAGIAEDWQTVATFVGTVAGEVEGVDDAEVPTTVATTLSGLDADAMSQASNRVTEFLKAGCGGAADDGASEGTDGADEGAG